MSIYTKRRYKSRRTSINYRRIYENHYGPIPRDEHNRTFEVHHLDGNSHNNNPLNLIALSILDHYELHLSMGDWAGARKIAIRMKKTPEEISELSRKMNKRRVQNGTHNFMGASGSKLAKARTKRLLENGTHHFLGGDIQRRLNKRRVAEGVHVFLRRTDGTSLSQDRVNAGTHNFLTDENGENLQTKRVKAGTHHLLKRPDGTSVQTDRVKAGTHHLQHPKEWTCENCGKNGKGQANYNRWHDPKSPKSCHHKISLSKNLC